MISTNERECEKAERLATRKLVCECVCDDSDCDRVWWAPADTADQRIEWTCSRGELRAEPDGRVVCIERHEPVEVETDGEVPDADDLTKL